MFCGSGATGAIDKLVRVLESRAGAERRWCSSVPTSTTRTSCPGASRSPTWSRSARTPTAASTSNTSKRARAPPDRPLKIGSFSAASNVTGIVTTSTRSRSLLHRHGALSLLGLRRGRAVRADRHEPRRRPDGHLAYKDAVFLSPHKFVGGPGTPGVLVAKRALLANRVPTVPGGGTIVFVSPSGQ